MYDSSVSTWTVIQHVAFEHPGLITEIAHAHGVELNVRRMDLGEPLPRLDTVSGLVVLGGPMAPTTTPSIRTPQNGRF